MSSPLALLLTLVSVAYLFWRDVCQKPSITNALWIPFLWTFISGSRYISEWMIVFGVPVPGGSLEEGSPIDRAFYIGMIVAGLYILRQRQIDVSKLLRNNVWLAVFLFYCFAAVVWSDFPFVSLKRWIKVLGHPIMALVVLTEPNPVESLGRLMKRCAYLLIPVSILFIKYYPEWGRGFSFWTGEGYNTGITTDKNALGVNGLIFGLFFTWHLLKVWQLPKSKARRDEVLLCVAFLAMNGWLLSVSNSKTPLVSLLLAMVVMLFVGFEWVNRRMIGFYLASAVVLVVALESFFGVSDVALQMLGRSATLTDRTVLWQDLLTVPVNPIIGAGFESFWMGERLQELWARHPWMPNQAHNGYLETYINLGLLGLALLIILLLATYRKTRETLLVDLHWGRFRLAYLAAAIVYNWTEAGFKTVHFVFFVFYIIAIDYTRPVSRLTERPNQSERMRRPLTSLSHPRSRSYYG